VLLIVLFVDQEGYVSRMASFEPIPCEYLTSLCDSRCAEDIEATRTAIKKACTADTDIMLHQEDSAYPGTWIEFQYTRFQCLHIVPSNIFC
jgi:hypothetical protein